METPRQFRPLAEEVALPAPGSDEPRITDEELLEAARKGERPAFEILYERHGARMKSIAANLLRSLPDAEDAVQESFLKVYRGAASFRGGARFSTWIYRILLNTCYDLMRRRRRHPEEEATGERSDADLPAPAFDHPLRLELEDSLARLKERPREVFLLSAVEGFTHREIGEVLSIPEATSRTLLFEARRELQRLLWRGRAGEAPA